MKVLTSGHALFIQPHYDDVPLSCGGTVARMVAQGDSPHMITVFASDLVDEMVGDFAAWKHSRWKVTDADHVLAVRRAEDAEAAQALGCGVRWLGLPDAIYRVGRYRSDAELLGHLPDEELVLAMLRGDVNRTIADSQAAQHRFDPLALRHPGNNQR